MRKLVSIDRVSEGIAVLEGPERELSRVPLSRLPPGAREGDCLWEEDGSYTPAPEETETRRQKNRELFARLKKKNPGQ